MCTEKMNDFYLAIVKHTLHLIISLENLQLNEWRLMRGIVSLTLNMANKNHPRRASITSLRLLAKTASTRGSGAFWKSISTPSNSSMSNVPSCVAPFERSEMTLGRRLGSGSFSDVYKSNLSIYPIRGTAATLRKKSRRDVTWPMIWQIQKAQDMSSSN